VLRLARHFFQNRFSPMNFDFPPLTNLAWKIVVSTQIFPPV